MDKKCKYCAMMIPEDAKLCPHCRKSQEKVSTGKGLLVFLGFIVLVAVIVAAINTSGDNPKQVYTAEQKQAAKEYQALLVTNGLVSDAKLEDDVQVVYVNRTMWNLGTFENKKLILKTLSQSNETLGRTARVEIRDSRSGKVYGVISPNTFKINE